MDDEDGIGMGTWSGGVALFMQGSGEVLVAKLTCEEATEIARDLLMQVQVYEAEQAAGLTGDGGDA